MILWDNPFLSNGWHCGARGMADLSSDMSINGLLESWKDKSAEDSKSKDNSTVD
jgi:hypothetical protein